VFACNFDRPSGAAVRQLMSHTFGQPLALRGVQMVASVLERQPRADRAALSPFVRKLSSRYWGDAGSPRVVTETRDELRRERRFWRIYGPKPDHQSIREARSTGRFLRLAIRPACAMQSLPGGRLHAEWYTQSRKECSAPDESRAIHRTNATRIRRTVCTIAIIQI
jgi:hypothetical protein